jgi:cytochrome oxidase Cu insertion factor (SCO1/SenC/PrrC family)
LTQLKSPRVVTWLLTGGAAVLVIGSLLLFRQLATAAVGSHRAPASVASTAAANQSANQGIDMGSVPAPAFTLKDQTGATVSLAQFHGRPVVLTFFDSVCPHADCSLMAEYLNWTARDLGAQSGAIGWVALSVNPWHDTPASASAFLAVHQVAVPLRYLLGTPAQLAPVWDAYHMQAIEQSNGIVLHSTGVYVVDAQGRERMFFFEGFDPKQLSAYLQRLLAGTSLPSGSATPAPSNNAITFSQVANGNTIALTVIPAPFGNYDYTVVAQDAQGTPIPGARVSLDLTMPAMAMAPLRINLTPVSPPIPGAYGARGVISMRGLWQVVVHVQPPNGAAAVQATFQFTAQY